MIFTRGLRVCLAVEPADLRRGFEGLASLVRERLKEDERSSQIFVFTNKRRNRLKILYFDGTGTWVLAKRLERGTFSWPKASRSGQVKLSLAPEALAMLTDGIDLRDGCRRGWFERD